MLQTVQWTVAADEDTLRLDSFLITRLPALSRQAIHALIAQGQVLLNGHKSKKGVRIRAGDIITAPAPLPLTANADLSVDVVYVDDAVIVINKPAGAPSVVLRHGETGTVANVLAARFPEIVWAGQTPLESGLAHRLDTATSGLLVAARTPAAYALLRQQFRAQTVEKRYLALVTGRFELTEQAVFHLAPTGPRGRRMRLAASGEGQKASSLYTPLETLPGHTVIQITITTGVRHQIRAHLSEIGHPIVGDSLYGGAEAEGTLRLCLHAHVLAFAHPTTGQKLRFESPLPQDFLTLIECRRHREKTHKRADKVFADE